MNKYDIKKALKFCADSNDCDDCPYDVVRSCSDRLKLDARELIAEQEKEIERLKDEDTRLTEKLKQVLLAVDTVKEMNTMCNIDKQNAEIERLKDDYAKLQELFAQYQMASDKEIKAQKEEAEKRFENNMKSVLEIEKKQAVKEFAEKVKGEVYPFLQAEMYNKKHFITGDLISDKLLENQNIGILKAQDVLSKWFKVKIDELLKEYEDDKRRD